MVKSPSNCKKSLKSVKIVKNPSKALVALKKTLVALKDFGVPQKLWCVKSFGVSKVSFKSVMTYTNIQMHNVICTMSFAQCHVSCFD